MAEAAAHLYDWTWRKRGQVEMPSWAARLGRRFMKKQSTETTPQAMLPPESIQRRLRKIQSALAIIRQQGTVEIPPRRCRFRRSRPCSRV